MGNGSSRNRNRANNDTSVNSTTFGSIPNISPNNSSPVNPVPYSSNVGVLPPPPAGYVPAYPGLLPFNPPPYHGYNPSPNFYPGGHQNGYNPPQNLGNARFPYTFETWVRPPWMRPSFHPYPQPENARPIFSESRSTKTIKNEVNVNKSTLQLIGDPNFPGKHLITFSFDSSIDGSICIIPMAKEGECFSFTPTNPSAAPVTVQFQKGVAQKFTQPPGTGFDLSAYHRYPSAVHDGSIIPLVIRTLSCSKQLSEDSNFAADPSLPLPDFVQSQVTYASITPLSAGEYRIKALEQKIWVDGSSYKLQEIYGIENSSSDTGNEDDSDDNGKACVICLSEPRSTTVLPCRHMCMCKECANVLRTQCNKCPICRQPVESLLEIRVPKSEKI